MDIAGTKKKLQRMSKVAEESYKKMNEMMERMQKLQEDLETTSKQVDSIEYDLAEQRAIIEALAEEEDLDVEEILEEADLPEPPSENPGEDEDLAKKATSRPSANEAE